MNIRTVAAILFTALLFLFLAYAMMGYPEIGFIRPLGEFYLYNSFNAGNSTWWSAAPNALTGLLWDYRGYDTLYETMVFYIGATAIVIFFERAVPLKQGKGMSMIVRASTKFIFTFILTTAIVITVLSVKSAGGGFQGGSIVAIAYIVALVALSKGFLPNLKLDIGRAHFVRIFGLALIIGLALAPVVFSLLTGTNAYALQNQPKLWAPFGFPPFLGLASLSGGNLIPLSIGEMLQVGAGFILMFTLLTLKEEEEEE
jgi:multicomponent Na+:H+ antiporter subunit B